VPPVGQCRGVRRTHGAQSSGEVVVTERRLMTIDRLPDTRVLLESVTVKVRPVAVPPCGSARDDPRGGVENQPASKFLS